MADNENPTDGVSDFFARNPVLARILQMVLQELVRILRDSQKEDK